MMGVKERAFRRFFEQIVEQCRAAGLVWGKELYFDATQVKANASLGSSAPRFVVEAYLEDLCPAEATGEPDEGAETADAAKAACTDSDHGRTLQRSFHAAYVQRVRGYHGTAAFRRAMNKRRVWVEPLFGEAKEWHGLGRFRLRGLWKVNVEALLIAAGQNLKRLLRRGGWGRRPWPGGAPIGFPGSALETI